MFNQVYIKLYLSSAENINEQETFLDLLKMIDNPSEYTYIEVLKLCHVLLTDDFLDRSGTDGQFNKSKAAFLRNSAEYIYPPTKAEQDKRRAK